MAALRVLMVNYEFPPLGGGTGIACAQLLAEIAGRRDVRVDLVTSGVGAELARETLADNVEVHRVPTPKRDLHFWRASELFTWTRRALAYARELTERERFDVGHCWAGWPSGVVGHQLRGRMPYVVSLRGSDVPGYSRRLRLLDPLLMRHLCRRVWSRSARIVSVSRTLRALALETQPDAVIDVIPNGVDVSRFTPGPDSAAGLLFVGRLIERKGVNLLVEAFAGLAGEFPELTLTVVGDGPEQPQLQAMADALGLGNRIEFTGHLDREPLAAAYRRAAILVLPALSEAMPNVVLEAMASGLAIVTTRTGAGELLRGNGLTVDEPAVEPLRDTLATYLRDPELLLQHRHASRRVAEGMSWSLVADYFLAIYGEAITAADRPAEIPAREFHLPAR